MANDKDRGSSARPLTDTIAGTEPGIPDDAVAPEEELPISSKRRGEGDRAQVGHPSI